MPKLIALILVLSATGARAAEAPAAAAGDRGHGTLIPYREVFRRSVSDVSGDIFLLAEPFSYGLDPEDFDPAVFHASHLSTRHDGQIDVVVPPHPISMHGFAWDYDLRIPLAFYDPSGRWFKAGVYPQVAVQQDVAPTLADVLGIAAPDRSEGRILSEARLPPQAERPRVIAVLVQDQLGLQYLDAQPTRARFLRAMLAKSARFTNAQVAHVDVETSVGHAAIGTGGYARDHHITANNAWHPGLWSAAPVYSAALTETLASDAYPLQLDAATLSDVWMHERQNRPVIFSMVAAARASVSLGGHGAMFAGGKKTAVMYEEEKGPAAGTFKTNENFYFLPAAVQGKSVRPYAEAFQKEAGGEWYGNVLVKADGALAYPVVRASPAAVRFESDAVDGSMVELRIGERDETDLVFVNFKTTDYCGHLFGYESEECGEVLDAVDHALERLVTRLEQQSGGSLLVAFTADHGAAPIPELSGGVRYDKEKLRADLNARFGRPPGTSEVVPFLSSSQIWLNRRLLAKNGFTARDVVAYLKAYKVPFAPPWNMAAAAWRKRGKPAEQRLFRDVVSREELDHGQFGH